MRRMEMMTAGGVTLAGLGALVGLAIGSAGDSPKLAAARVQPVEVRTEIIRRTVNVYRREHPHHATAGGRGTGGTGGGSASGVPPGGAGGVAYAATRTRSSGAGAAAPAYAKPVVTTRSSGSKPAYASPSSGNSGPQPVKTASSGSKSTSGSASPGGSGSQAVKTRSSGGKGGGDNGGGHDD
jgi:hypothetical protein